jgi:hypothetical protein
MYVKIGRKTQTQDIRIQTDSMILKEFIHLKVLPDIEGSIDLQQRNYLCH